MEEMMKYFWISIAAVIGLLHIVSPLFKEKMEKIVGYVALCLHVPLFVFLLLSKEKIEVVAIVITLSLFLYIIANTLIPFVKRIIRDRDCGNAVTKPDDNSAPENISEEEENNDIQFG